jgi:heat shock protein HslJ
MLSLTACATVVRPTLDEIRHGTLRGIAETPITLRDGAYVGPPPAPGAASGLNVTLWNEPVAYGDLDGRGGAEAVVLVSVTTGGSGSFVYIAAFARRDGRLGEATATLVGDRVKVLGLSVANRRVTLDIVEAGPGDPLCCPSRLARKTYALQGATLVPVASVASPAASLADLAGTEWILIGFGDRPIVGDVRSPTLVVDGTRVSGFGGCNRYTGTINERRPGEVSIGPLATTNMACVGSAAEIEGRFLAGLSRVSRYTIVAGRLQLIYLEDGAPRPLTFERRGTTAPADPPR